METDTKLFIIALLMVSFYIFIITLCAILNIFTGTACCIGIIVGAFVTTIYTAFADDF